MDLILGKKYFSYSVKFQYNFISLEEQILEIVRNTL